MNKAAMMICILVLVGCNSPQPKNEPTVQETVSPRDYQACIQAAKSGNGQASEEDCNKVVKDTH